MESGGRRVGSENQSKPGRLGKAKCRYASFCFSSAIKHRRAAFTLMSTYFGRATAMVKGDRPFDRAELVRNIELVQFVAKLPWEAFIPGSEPGNTLERKVA